ncbi:MAG TPA: hypothetical protein VHA52_10870, partial [Candidatus Babeliaceae bacterium]|nr:hypothetical protein [Candidatus Babeliaceae bacterium]
MKQYLYYKRPIILFLLCSLFIHQQQKPISAIVRLIGTVAASVCPSVNTLLSIFGAFHLVYNTFQPQIVMTFEQTLEASQKPLQFCLSTDMPEHKLVQEHLDSYTQRILKQISFDSFDSNIPRSSIPLDQIIEDCSELPTTIAASLNLEKPIAEQFASACSQTASTIETSKIKPSAISQVPIFSAACGILTCGFAIKEVIAGYQSYKLAKKSLQLNHRFYKQKLAKLAVNQYSSLDQAIKVLLLSCDHQEYFSQACAIRLSLHKLNIPNLYKNIFDKTITHLHNIYFYADGELKLPTEAICREALQTIASLIAIILPKAQRSLYLKWYKQLNPQSYHLLKKLISQEHKELAIKPSFKNYLTTEYKILKDDINSLFTNRTPKLEAINNNSINRDIAAIMQAFQNNNCRAAQKISMFHQKGTIASKVYTHLHQAYHKEYCPKCGCYKQGHRDPKFIALPKKFKKKLHHSAYLPQVNKFLKARFDCYQALSSQLPIEAFEDDTYKDFLYAIIDAMAKDSTEAEKQKL